jgi:hypothetical protein
MTNRAREIGRPVGAAIDACVSIPGRWPGLTQGCPFGVEETSQLQDWRVGLVFGRAQTGLDRSDVA